MANSINWGKVYCVSEFGDEANILYTIPLASAPTCWAGTLVFSADDTTFTSDTTIYTADATKE